MLTTVAVAGYRSLRDVVLPLAPLTVVTGANGAGKSSLYRALRLLASAAEGDLVRDVARSGGLEALRWAGPENPRGAMRRGEVPVQGTVRSGPVRLLLGVGTDELGYAVDLGLPTPSEAGRFPHDPSVKAEVVFAGSFARPASVLVERRGARVRQRGDDGWEPVPDPVAPSASILTELADARTSPEVVGVRRMLGRWRFHDQLRVDDGAPARRPQVAVRSTVLADDGANLAATLATIEEIGRADVLAAAVARALDGSSIEVRDVRLGHGDVRVGHEGAGTGHLELVLRQPGLLRPVRAPELSEGTLRFLMLAAALLSPRPPELLVLNEPEGSLHPTLLAPLAALIADAAQETQILVVTHASALSDALARHGAEGVELVKEGGETRVAGLGTLEQPPWRWPER